MNAAQSARKCCTFSRVMGRTPRFAVWALVALAWSAEGRAQPAPSAEDTTAAEALIERGLAEREAGHDEAALQLFRQAFERAHSPRSQAQVALAAQALGQWIDAERELQGALGNTRDPWIRRNRAALEGALRVVQQHLGLLDLRGGVPGARVTVNGRALGVLPLVEPARVLVGTVTLEVRAAGYYPISRELTVTAGAVLRETVEMRPEPVAPAVAPSLATERVRETVHTHERVAGPQRAFGWVTLSLGAAGLGLGVAAHLIASNAASEWNDDPLCLPAQGTRFDACGDRYERALTYRAVSWAALVSGGLLGAVGALLLATAPRAQQTVTRSEARARLDCGPGPGAVGLSCVARF